MELIFLVFNSQNMKYIKGPDVAASVIDAEAKLKTLKDMADKHGCTLAQLCLAWSVRNKTSCSVVVSASTVEQFKEMLNALSVGHSTHF